VSDKLLDINISHTLNTASGILPMEIDLSVPVGSILAVTGQSGSGKTTFLRQLAGLAQPQSGYIQHADIVWFDNKAGINVPVQQRNIGFVFQDYALFPHLTVKQNLLFVLKKGEDDSTVHDLLKAVDLEQLADRKPHQLSGGQQQRVALARALVRKPDVLLLDEPLSALDHSMRGNLQDLLLKFHREFGFTMIIVTHDLAEIFRMADQVAVFDNGKITSRGTPSEVYMPKQTDSNDTAIYGEVISIEPMQDHLLVHALINHKIHRFELPLSQLSVIQPGVSFTIPFHLDTTKFQVIDDRSATDL
jgi:molybdate transport system ATP-binding protein